MLLILLEEFLCRVIFYLNYIVNVSFKTGMIESFGSGFNRTFLACKKNKVKCGYENTKSGFRFIFYRPHGHKNVQDMSKTCPRLKS